MALCHVAAMLVWSLLSPLKYVKLQWMTSKASLLLAIAIIAKSLGAIVTSFYLDKNSSSNLKVIVSGYAVGEVKTKALTPNLSSSPKEENRIKS